MKIPSLLALLLVPIILAAGCTTNIPGFGQDVISVQSRSVEEGLRDIIVVKDVQTLPRSPMLPDQEVLLSFVIENRDRVHTVKNVMFELFNAPGFRNVAGVPCNSGASVCTPELDNSIFCNSGGCGITAVLPGEEHLVQFRLRTPTKEQIANIRTQARLDFKVRYDFENSMNFVLPAVNKDEVIRRQREGEKLNIVFDKSFSSGPMRVDVEPLGVKYLLDDYETILLFTIKNTGGGTVLRSEIPTYNAVSMANAITGRVIPITGRAVDPRDQPCEDQRGSCTLVTLGCSGWFQKGLCGGSLDRQCCLPQASPAIATCTGCTQEGGAWCQQGARGYCASDGACISGYETRYVPAACDTSSGGTSSAGSPAISANTGYGGMLITFPSQVEVRLMPGDAAAAIFTTVSSTQDGVTYANTEKPIQIYRDQSQVSIRFPLKLSFDTFREFKSNQIPFRSYEIKTKVFYTYELRNMIDVTVNPFENV